MTSTENITIEGARIMFKNFSGLPGQFNAKGDRNFCLMLDPETASYMQERGWNIKHLKPREEGDEPQPYVKVAVNIDGYNAAKVTLVSSAGKTRLDEDTIGSLDFAVLQNVDLIIRPYDWEVNGKTGRKAYLKTLFATIEEDDLERKYYEATEESAIDCQPGMACWIG